jgi:N-acetylglucosaminyl-diphospho-decaprenol L-rhamnosyltransferase
MAGARPLFSAVVVSYFTGSVLENCLAALTASDLCGQIILVDNGNPATDYDALVIRAARTPKLVLVSGHGNIGFGRACNLGVSHATNELLVFVNPDCMIDEETLTVFSDALACYPEALIGGNLRNLDKSEQRGCRRGELTPRSACISFLGMGKAGETAGIWRDFNRTNEPMPEGLVDMPVVSGALMATTVAAFQKVGGFDSAFFLHVEDIDLCRRMREQGGMVKFAPQATALHIGATSAVSSWGVERAKIGSFGHYFWKNAHTIGAQISVLALMPLLALAIVVRAIFKKT